LVRLTELTAGDAAAVKAAIRSPASVCNDPDLTVTGRKGLLTREATGGDAAIAYEVVIPNQGYYIHGIAVSGRYLVDVYGPLEPPQTPAIGMSDWQRSRTASSTACWGLISSAKAHDPFKEGNQIRRQQRRAPRDRQPEPSRPVCSSAHKAWPVQLHPAHYGDFAPRS